MNSFLFNEIPAEKRFELLVTNISDYAIYLLTPGGTVNSWNAGAQRFKGYQAEEVIGTHFSRFYTEEDRAGGLPDKALLTAEKEGRFETEGWRVRKDGSRFWAHVVIDRIQDEAGRLLGFAKITRDITERKAAQDALRQSEERFRLLVKGVIDYAIYMLSPEGEITNWNLGAERIKGYSSDEVIGSHFSRFYTEDDRARKVPEEVLATAKREGRFESEGWRIRKDGSAFWAHVIIDSLYDDDGNHIGFAKVTRDITEKRQAAEAREKAERFQLQKLESLGKLTGGVAHDFNNLLAIIVNGMEVLGKEVQSVNGIRLLESMRRAASRGATLTQQLLAYARQQPLRRTRCNLNQVIENFEAVLRQAGHPGILFSVNLAADLNETELDAAQFETSLLNLVVNARDAIPATGTILITTENVKMEKGSAIGSLPPGPYVKVTIRDTGSGMPRNIAERVFEPFFTTKPVGKGTGMGLSQVYGFVKQSEGEITLDSEIDRGTTIAMYFPAVPCESKKDNEETSESALEKVLLVDDEPDLLETTAELFRSMDYEVFTAQNGRDALEILDSAPDIKILFTDIVMPGEINGVELARATQRLYPHIKIILVSGHARPALAAKHGELDDLVFINKPYRFSELAKQLRSA
jgi:PAS domain S-box-containing protein